MKKLLSLTLLLAVMFGGARAQTCSTTISTYPYYQNFESGAGGWTSGGSLSTWALGTPTSNIINSASSGTNAWVTNLTGKHATNEQSYVESPCFNTTSLTAPVIEMRIWWDIEFGWDGAVLQSSIDNGATWQNVGAFGDPDNWYTDNTLEAGPGGQSTVSGEGWSGTPGASGSNGWVTARHALSGLGGKTNLKLRFAFGSDGAVEEDGFAFDDIRIYETPVNDAAVTAVTSPSGAVTPGVSTPVSVTIKNYGSTALTSATLGFSVNGTTVINNYAFAGNVAPGATSSAVTIGNHLFTAGPNIIKAWTRLPNGGTDGNTRNDTLTYRIYACTTLSGTFTINNNNAPSPTNFQSIAEAVSALKTCGISGAVVFNVASGSGPYNSSILLTAITGASGTNTITFNGNGATIISGNPGTVNGVITFDGADYVKFDNFVITLDPTAVSGWGVQLMNEANNNTITNSTINLPLTSTSSNINGIVFGTTTSTAANNGNNNIFSNNTINGGYYAFRINGPTGATGAVGNQIINNTIRDNYIYNIYLSNTESTLIEGNTISRPTRGTVSTFYGVFMTGTSKSNIISKNRFHNAFGGVSSSTGTAYVIYHSSTDAPAGSENIIRNNLIYDINTNGLVYAFYNSGSDGAYYYHNTIDLNEATNTGTVRGFFQTTAASNIKFQNNIVVVDGGASGTKHALYYATTTSTIVSDNNVLYTTGTANVGSWGTANQATLAAWRTASSKDANSVAADPQFVNRATGIYRPTNSSVNNIGAPVGVTDDITGAARSATTPDPGAYEFTPAANDGGITAIITPTSPVTPGVSQPVQVTIKNYGLSALTSATITWTVNGVAQTPFSWTGNLANNATANVTIGNYTFPAGTYTLVVCVTTVNGTTNANPGNDCHQVDIISCNPMSGIFTIDKNNPVSATNFQSISAAALQVGSCGVTGPVTFNVVANTGPYTEHVTLSQIPGASPTNTVTFNGNGNILRGTSAGGTTVMLLDGADYIRVNNLTIEAEATATAGQVVHLTNGADNNIFNNNTIKHSTTTTSTSYAVYIYTGSNNNNTFSNNTITGAYYSIYNYGASGSVHNGNQFTGNTIKDQYAYGIYNYYVTNTVMEGNDISRPTRTTVTTMYGITLSTGTTGSTISKNRIHNSHDAATSLTGTVYGIYLTGADATVGNENVVKNNLIYNINTNGTIYGIYTTSSDGNHNFHNTIVLDQSTSTGTVRGIYQATAATNVKVQNNIVVVGQGASGTKHALYYGTTTSTITSDNNVLHAIGTANVGSWGTANQTTLTAWRTASSKDANSVAADPQFVDPATGNFRPTNVAANNIGDPVGVTDDITGATRSSTTPDPGAYEFTVNPNDVGVIAITGAASGCGLTANQTITITVKNFGSQPQSNIPVNFLVGGTIIGTGTIAGPLAPNATATFTFTATANLAAPGPYVIIANTLLSGDADASNDSFTLNVTNALIPNLPIVLDFETPTSGIGAVQVVTNPNSTITEGTGASNGGTSTKGMIMAGINNPNWVTPVGVVNPWTNNPNHFSAVYMCINPATGPALDSLFMEFDMKQLFKTAAANTNFRVTVNGTQVGPTYNPPFSGSPIVWQHIKVDLTPYKNMSSVQIGLESSVKEEYAGGNGTANLLDNLIVSRWVTGVKSDILAAQINVYPNPSTGIFNVSAPKGNYTVEITDMTGKTILKQAVNNASTQLNLKDAAKGIYLMKIVSEGSIATKRLVIE